MFTKEMNILKAETINFLVKNACSSISLRTKKEILKDNFSIDNEKLIDEKVNLVLSWQLPDGYFGTRLHTSPSKSKIWPHECCVRYLLEKGFSVDFKPLKKSLDVLLKDGWEKEFIGSKAGLILGCGIIRASLFSQAGLHEHAFMQEHIEKALFRFEIVTKASGYSDIAVPHKDKYIYQKGKWLPEVYAFRILAYTFSWRIKKNMDMLSKAYSNLYKWLPFPPTYIKAGSQLVAPFGHIALPFNDDFDEAIGYPWLDFYEMSARMGMLTNKSPFYKHFQNLVETAIKTKGEIFRNVDKKYFISWSSYSGLALEETWKNKQNKINDLLFRCCLIDSIANNTV